MKFPESYRQILTRIKRRGHEVFSLAIAPYSNAINPYISYGLGTCVSLRRAMEDSFDIFLAERVEAGAFSYFCKKIKGKPLVFYHVDEYSKIARDGNERLRPYYTWFLEKRVPKLADHVITVTERFKIRLVSWGVSKSKITVINNGADTKMFNPNVTGREIREKFNLKEDPVVVYVGKIEQYYHLDVIVKAASIVLKKEPSSKFLFVGFGRDLDNLKSLVEKLGISNSVIFTGFQPHERIPSFIGAADVTVFPHPSGIAVHEYMACGKAVVKLKEEAGDVLEHLESGYLVENRSPEEFAEGILNILSDRELAVKLGRNARKLAVEKYDWEHLTDKYLEVLQNV